MTDNFIRAVHRSKAIQDALDAGFTVEVLSNPFLDMMRTNMAMKPKPKPAPMKPGKGKKC